MHNQLFALSFHFMMDRSMPAPASLSLISSMSTINALVKLTWSCLLPSQTLERVSMQIFWDQWNKQIVRLCLDDYLNWSAPKGVSLRLSVVFMMKNNNWFFFQLNVQ